MNTVQLSVFCGDFDEDNLAYVQINSFKGHMTLSDMIALRNYLTNKIEERQQPVAEKMKRISSNVSPEIEEEEEMRPYPETKPRSNGKYFALCLNEEKNIRSVEILKFENGSFPEEYNVVYWAKNKLK